MAVPVGCVTLLLVAVGVLMLQRRRRRRCLCSNDGTGVAFTFQGKRQAAGGDAAADDSPGSHGSTEAAFGRLARSSCGDGNGRPITYLIVSSPGGVKRCIPGVQVDVGAAATSAQGPYPAAGATSANDDCGPASAEAPQGAAGASDVASSSTPANTAGGTTTTITTTRSAGGTRSAPSGAFAQQRQRPLGSGDLLFPATGSGGGGTTLQPAEVDSVLQVRWGWWRACVWGLAGERQGAP